MEPDDFRDVMARVGWVQLDSGLRPAFLSDLRAALDRACEHCREIQVRNGVGAGTDGTVHHVVGLDGHFLQMLEELSIWPYLDVYFGGKYIVNSYGGVVNRAEGRSYVGRVHRDIRTFSGPLPLMLNVLVMLDPFTRENGGTYLLGGSHLTPDRLADEAFFAQAVQAVGPAGTALLFNSNLWHAAGVNRTEDPRRALTLTLTPPHLKQQCDYPRLLGYDRVGEFSPWLRQLLGYNARIPASLEEWYQPADKRLYHPDQG